MATADRPLTDAHIHVLSCGPAAAAALAALPPGFLGNASTGDAFTGDAPLVTELPLVPDRRDLTFLDDAARATLPADPTPSLEEIAASPKVTHLGEPQPAPQQPHLNHRLRVVVVGTDASLSAVLTRMMRADYLWAEVGFVPVGEPAADAAAQNWGLHTDPAEALRVALTAPARPTPLIRTDTSLAVAGSATLEHAEGREFIGEVVVDNAVILHHPEEIDEHRFDGQYGVRLVPMTTAPGIMAVAARTPLRIEDAPSPGLGGWLARRIAPQRAEWLAGQKATSWMVRGAKAETVRFDPDSLATGRAVQAGGAQIRCFVDGRPATRHAVDRAVFYRHLRDAQIVRP